MIRFVCILLLAALPTSAAVAQTIAAMSLIGYQMSIVMAGHSTGSSRDTNVYETMPIPDRTFDSAALRAVDDAVQKARPDAKVVLLSGRDPAWAANVNGDLTPGSRDFVAVAGGVAQAAAQAGAQRVIVVLPMRADLRMRFEQGSYGRGRAAGLGLYVDHDTPVRSVDNREVADGFLGVFANFRVAVLEAPSGRVLADDTITAGTAFSAARSKNGDPMTALSGEQKAAAFERLLRTEIDRAVPPLLARVS